MKKNDGHRMVFPNLLFILIAVHIVYYIHIFERADKYGSTVVLLALFLASIGYWLARHTYIGINPAQCGRQMEKILADTDSRKLSRIGAALGSIGFFAYIAYYSRNLQAIVIYGDNYTLGRGSGYITAFFYLLPIGMLLVEYACYCASKSRKMRIINIIIMLIYASFNFFVLLKRRQVLLLIVGLIAIHANRVKLWKRVVFYCGMILGYCALMLFGRLRGYVSTYGFGGIADHLVQDFSWEWLALNQTEGKYTSQILIDVLDYASKYGHTSSALVGVAVSLIPRALFSNMRPLAFPEWYTFTFYPSYYTLGYGFAGSLIAELYLIGGYFFVGVGYLLVGLACGLFQKRAVYSCRRGLPVNIFYAVFIYTVLFLPRFDLASLLIDLIFIYLPIYLSFRLSKKPQWKGAIRSQ